jgi:Family of unknown function (DUF6585)
MTVNPGSGERNLTTQATDSKIPPEAAGLGQLLESHVPSEANQALTWSVMILGVLFSGGAMVVGVVSRDTATHELTQVAPFLLGGIFLALTFVVGLNLYGQRGTRLMIFEDGIAFTQGGLSWAIRWSEIAEYFDRRSQISIKGRDRRGFRFSLSRLRDPSAIKARVEEMVMRHLLPVLTERFEAGEEVPFGPLSLSIFGVHHDGRVVPWESLSSVQVAVLRGGARLFHFRKGGLIPFCSVWADNIPNFRVFYHLFQQKRPNVWW